MSVQEQVQETCEACGCVAEIGSIISEGDDQVVLTVEAANAEEAEARLASFIELARAIYSDVVVAKESASSEVGVTLTCQLTFSCTAEKIIFEMRSRAI
ncbi:DUF406 family protein [Pseudaeromonas sharmana]|uniref:DUF406 family protein n=1 Tax=Pseudaeromonas sharmana TaxID=328412 RepID=A0ABV8CML4_9GAMM